jgi:sugar phosphate isomerase/epimerase
MRRSIATVSMSGTLREKLEAIAAARFDGYELFENDLIYFNGSPAAVATIAADLGLSCELYQTFARRCLPEKPRSCGTQIRCDAGGRRASDAGLFQYVAPAHPG